MNKFSLLFIVVLFSVFAYSQNIAFQTIEHDFGEVKAEDGALYYNFKLKNVGTKQEKIGNLSPSCSCLYVTMKDKVLEPGEEAEIRVTLSPSGYAGLVYRTVDVFSAEGQHLETLSLYANVIPSKEDIRSFYPIFISENLLSNRDNLNFGYLYWSNSSELAVGIANISSKTLTLSAIAKGSGRGVVSCPRSIGPGERAEIVVRYTSQAGSYLALSDELQIFVDGVAVDKAISLKCIMLEKIEKTPQSASLWSTPSIARLQKRGAKYLGTIKLGNSGKSDLEILAIDGGSAQINIEKGTKIASGKTLNIKVKSDRNEAKVVFFTNDPVRPYKELIFTNK